MRYTHFTVPPPPTGVLPAGRACRTDCYDDMADQSGTHASLYH
ncbi:hypothetical protein Q8791_23355 [Nocardiopsis sp. CT-R113]|uniref:Uncharacterized protein n=1 Tax=Nocardiopsis codii TaxID=3065942 RepID=A0ABU7KD43_9ACTN|nr:hypothetical protein [Nocardiopsis sp. CT-R113]MEE2040158.1 hypothetical protein [Nocardiopsis sp. CT-R113]